MAEDDRELRDAQIRLIQEIDQLEASVVKGGVIERLVADGTAWLATAEDREEIAEAAFEWQHDFDQYTQAVASAAKQVLVVIELVRKHPFPDLFRGLEVASTSVVAFSRAAQGLGELLLEAHRKLKEE
jgi:hypothetical protein